MAEKNGSCVKMSEDRNEEEACRKQRIDQNKWTPSAMDWDEEEEGCSAVALETLSFSTEFVNSKS